MFRWKNWLLNLVQRLKAGRQLTSRRHHFVPRVRQMEERCNPTVFTVTTTADVVGGPGLSLREAIDLANANGTPDAILLPAGTIRVAIAGQNEEANAKGDFDI